MGSESSYTNSNSSEGSSSSIKQKKSVRFTDSVDSGSLEEGTFSKTDEGASIICTETGETGSSSESGGGFLASALNVVSSIREFVSSSHSDCEVSV